MATCKYEMNDQSNMAKQGHTMNNEARDDEIFVLWDGLPGKRGDGG